jgi:hypothetical protein
MFVKQLHKRSAQEAAEISELEALIEGGAPPKGSGPSMEAAAEGASYAAARTFEELPLSQYTKVNGIRSPYAPILQRALHRPMHVGPLSMQNALWSHRRRACPPPSMSHSQPSSAQRSRTHWLAGTSLEPPRLGLARQSLSSFR